MRYMRVFVVALFFVCIYLANDVRGQKNIYKAAPDNDGIQRITVIGGEYFFNPDYIIVKVNIPVELTIRKEPGVVPHDMVIREPEAGIDFSEPLTTEPKIIRFTPKKVGKYQFYCSKKLLFFKSHRNRGMQGIIEVAE